MSRATELHGEYMKTTEHVASVITSVTKRDLASPQKGKQETPVSLTHAMDHGLMVENPAALADPESS